MSYVFVVDTNRQPLNPVHPGRARTLLSTGKAAILRRYPFTIILKEAVPQPQVTPLRVKIDPGSRVTGLALVDDAKGTVVWAAELTHRGGIIKKRLEERKGVRRGRRSRKLRHRPARFNNRTKPKGWLPPSLQSRVYNVTTWVERLRRYAPIGAISMELVKFDTQLMQNPEISGVEYQQGELAGYEVREYLLEKWGRKCAYCGAEHVPFEVEHITPRSRGGPDRVSNLTIACGPCNDRKGNMTAAEFGFPDIQAKAKAPLKDAAAVNATRWALYGALQKTGLSVECGSGGLTKYNRTKRGLPKTHWLDAACVGASTPATMVHTGIRPLAIKANGWGSRQMCQTNAYGFPRSHRSQVKSVHGFQTGDIIRAVVPKGKNIGTHEARVVVRAEGKFHVGKVDGIWWKHCSLVQHTDGYSYAV